MTTANLPRAAGTPTPTVDVNCDIGEGFGRWRMPNDPELMTLVTTVNVAAGFHAGDPTTIRSTVRTALANGVDIGVHVGLPDLLGFGRRAMSVSPAEVRDYCTYQIGAVEAFVRAAGGVLTHVKPHGALYTMAARDREVAGAVAAATADHDTSLRLFLLDDHCRETVEAHGVELVVEGFPELDYADDGTLVIERDKAPWDPTLVAERALRMVRSGTVRALSGADVSARVSTVCVHSDAPNAVEVARAVREGLEAAGVEVAPLSTGAPRGGAARGGATS